MADVWYLCPAVRVKMCANECPLLCLPGPATSFQAPCLTQGGIAREVVFWLTGHKDPWLSRRILFPVRVSSNVLDSMRRYTVSIVGLADPPGQRQTSLL